MYLENFSNLDDVLREFCVVGHGYDKINVLLAIYTYEDYDGSAFVLFEQDGVLYEVNGGHCSCYGLEDQWEPEKTSVEALRHRIEHGYFGGTYSYDYRNELQKVLNKWEA